MNLSISPAFLFFFSPQPPSHEWVRDLPFALPLPTPLQRITIILFFLQLPLCISDFMLFPVPPFCALFWPLYTAIGVDASASIIFLRRISSLTFSYFPCPSSFSFCCLFPSLYPIGFYLLVSAVALCCFLREFLIPQHFPEALTGFHGRPSCRALLQLSIIPRVSQLSLHSKRLFRIAEISLWVDIKIIPHSALPITSTSSLFDCFSFMVNYHC